MRTMTVLHRSPAEVDRLLLTHLNAAREGMDAAELAMRVGCSAERIKGHLSRLAREGNAHRRDTPSGPVWTAH